MYDLWYATGLAVMRPALLDDINAAGPVFNFVDRIINEGPVGGPLKPRPQAPSTGLLENLPTTKVRLAIAKFVKTFSATAPPISLYCAGRFSQYLKMARFSSALPATSRFIDIIAVANQGYLKAISHLPESTLPSMPAFIGACMMDGALASNLSNPTEEQIDIAREFGLVADPADPSWQIAVAFAGSDEYAQAAGLLMAGDEDPWNGGSGEQIIFWNTFNEHAIP